MVPVMGDRVAVSCVSGFSWISLHTTCQIEEHRVTKAHRMRSIISLLTRAVKKQLLQINF